MFHQVLDVGGPERSVWPAGESEGGVPAGAQRQCTIISLLLWSGFCLGPSGLWPLTSSHSQTTIPLCWSPNSPSISLVFIRLSPLLRSADECFKTDCRGDGRDGGGGRDGGRMSAVGQRDEINTEMINRILQMRTQRHCKCEESKENDVQVQKQVVLQSVTGQIAATWILFITTIYHIKVNERQ